ncbi:MAG: sulfite oxidase-like oxidoreductase [Armatimonadota bacterium]|nr:sulfite oxidase-like oxidoreductase [Armatimonadota bacterium]MDR7484975.1 sulfite oxidase-like oxidoreductase [Armatimonadota bacterium]MDR7533678.1 sulfite oxidase-like oxidoreductase [Armatimonadota bacterium]MDR7535489.1 sulfite oxidase-like oxidoreductase [Armatimonadota bacterium]
MRQSAGRVPPGQYVTEKWPVLHYGSIPQFDPLRWDFRLFGLVEQPVTLSYEEFRALPTTVLTCDIHCVTAWSRLGVVFEGVAARTVLGLAAPRPEARFVMVHAEQGYETNLPLEYLQADDALFAWRADGRDLTPEHGWPLRLVVPRLYFWKSAKWVRGLELVASDRAGFWERNGYHMRGDPWKEERYSSPW